ncbi:MAG: Peptidoglycan/xylan/chitin deacetylase [Candidatus Alkanophagales archaeon MCA70_species_2]|nr:Peptidoglycan/xylan/chitin deacetylase [Candidatus Alkanophaga liquidiphilum]
MYFLMTADVESFSIPLNREDPGVVKQVYEEGLPRLLSLLAKHDVCGTFYFTGTFAEASPESVELVKEHGHEVGCHGYDHSPHRAFDLLSYKEQLNDLKKAKAAIESVAGKIVSFRAPALRINEDTVRALEETGFRTDSSVCSQRFDGPFTFGSKRKLKWLFAPRRPYMLSYDSVVKPGNSKILEIPVSAFLFPYIGTMMRVSPLITRILRKYLYHESKNTGKPIVFLFHPNECLDTGNEIATTRRTNNPVEHLFADVIRHKLKLKNMGLASLKLLDEVLHSAKKCGFEFVTVNAYRKVYKTN